MVLRHRSGRDVEREAPESPRRDDDDLDQPYDRIRDAATLPEDPGLAPALASRDGVCAMHRMKAQIRGPGAIALEDAGALHWIDTMERAIAKGEVAPCSCAVKP
jgi:hypothetical protein